MPIFAWILCGLTAIFYEDIFGDDFAEISGIYRIHIVGIFSVIASTMLPNIIHNINGRKVFELRYVIVNSLLIIILMFLVVYTNLSLINWTYLFYLCWVVSGVLLFPKLEHKKIPVLITILSILSLVYAWY